MDLIYPEHNHPHGVDNLSPNEHRIWVCEECGIVFVDEEIRTDIEKCKENWGHICKRFVKRSGIRCESHLEPYLPELGNTTTIPSK